MVKKGYTLTMNRSSYSIRTLPKEIVEALGWQKGDKISITANPYEGTLIISNKDRKPVGFTKFGLWYQQIMWNKNKKQYQKRIRSSLSEDTWESKEARRILYETDWDKVDPPNVAPKVTKKWKKVKK